MGRKKATYKRLGNNKGQNDIEYLVVTAAAVLVYLIFMNTQSSPMKDGLENTFNYSVGGITRLNTELQFTANRWFY